MKRFLILIIACIGIICIISYLYFEHKVNIRNITKENMPYEEIYKKEITSNQLATIINRAMNSNNIKEVEKDSRGVYKDNNTNSINIDVKFLQSDKPYPIEPIYEDNITTFVKMYNNSKFKCTNIEYHKKTKLIKYMYFEQIT